MTIICGVDTDDLGEDFAASTSGKALIMDGDGPAYVQAATVKTVPTGVRHFHTKVLEAMFLADCSTAEVYLTSEDCFKAGRFCVKAEKDYQGQRKGSAKPPLLTAMREGIHEYDPPEGVEIHMENSVEADDAMMMKAYALGNDGVIRSEDKDLRMTPYPWYDIKTATVMPADPFGSLWIEETESGAKKLVGRSLKFFWAQMVMGDTADNVKGLLKLDGKNVGLVGTYELLNPLADIESVCNTVIDAYRAIDQNPLPEAWLLWLLRSPDDNVWRYFCELPWSPTNQAFLADCVTRDWFNRAGG